MSDSSFRVALDSVIDYQRLADALLVKMQPHFDRMRQREEVDFVSRDVVMERLGIASSKLHALTREPGWPRPIIDSPLRWDWKEIDAYLRERGGVAGRKKRRVRKA
ncbi:MAG: hypothetical protein AAF772_05275 [Acidobacteriota bacterium]